MEQKKRFAIFFDNLKKYTQKRLIAEELQETYGFDDMESEVLSLHIDENLHGFNEEHPADSKLLQFVHAETDCGCWLLVWDAEEHEFNTVMKD